jgi:hypothetical protein
MKAVAVGLLAESRVRWPVLATARIVCISACIDTGLRCPRVRTSPAVVVRPVVVVAAQDDLDEGCAEREAHRVLGGRVGGLREVGLRLVHFW